MMILLFALGGLLVLAGTIGAYALLGGFGRALSPNSIEWANFCQHRLRTDPLY